MRRPGRRGGALLAGLAALLAGCTTASPKPQADILWPEPPLTPRIKFVGLLRNQRDIQAAQAGKSARQWFEETLLGSKNVQSALRQPMGVALSRDEQRLYVTDYAKPGVVVFDFKTRTVGPLGGAHVTFQSPIGIAVDGNDRIYVVDSGQRAIQVFNPTGTLARSMTHETLERPTGIAIDPARNRLYVADSSKLSSDQHVVRVFDLEGHYLKALGAQGSAEGQLFFPTYLAVDATGSLYVADTMNARVQVFDPDGQYVKTIGEHGDAFGMFDKPKGIALDSFGNVYVVDSAWSNVQIFNQQGQILLFFGGRGYVPGLLFNPTGIAIGQDNRIYVADAFNARVALYQLINTTAQDSLAAPSTASEEAQPVESPAAPQIEASPVGDAAMPSE